MDAGTRTEESAEPQAAVAADLRPVVEAGRLAGVTIADVRILDPVKNGLAPWKSVP